MMIAKVPNENAYLKSLEILVQIVLTEPIKYSFSVNLVLTHICLNQIGI